MSELFEDLDGIPDVLLGGVLGVESFLFSAFFCRSGKSWTWKRGCWMDTSSGTSFAKHTAVGATVVPQCALDPRP